MKRVQQGFTFIELMIVVAIVGILAAIALPAYSDYIVRSKVSEGLASAAACKTTVAEYLATKGVMPGTATAGCSDLDTVYTKAPTIVAGVITIPLQGTGSAIDGKNLILTPTPSGTAITKWVCTTDSTDLKFFPASCR